MKLSRNVISLSVFILCVFPLSGAVRDSTDLHSFFPYHKGDVRQYRSAYTGEITGTEYTDSIRVDSTSGETFIFGSNRAGGPSTFHYRIDSLGNVYNMDFQPDFVRYKLHADSGESWIGGYDIYNGDTARVYRWFVASVFRSSVFGVLTTTKVFRIDVIQFGINDTSWLGNDYLAAGFGLVRTDIEPSDVYYLSGAIIDTNHYGRIDGVQSKQALPPMGYELFPNYPNPFNPITDVRFQVPVAGLVSLKVYDVLGREVATLVDGVKQAGVHSVRWNASNQPSGVYFCRLSAGQFNETRKMILMR